MALEINIASSRLRHDSVATGLINHIKSEQETLGITDGVLYYDFPLFRDTDDILYRSQVLLASPSHGLVLFSTSELTDRTCTPAELKELDDRLSQLYSIIYGRLLKSRLLRASRDQLLFTPMTALFLPNVQGPAFNPGNLESDVLRSYARVDDLLGASERPVPLPQDVWAELRSLIDGAKGLLRPKDREVPAEFANGKAAILKRLESEIANFDTEQRRAAISIVDGPQRIRGLAGSGKTVVLAMKAAHLHLSQPEARILVTFHTKSLYGFIKRLITRFYRQFNDRDPDFEDRLHVQHSWGGRSLPGVYSSACLDAGVVPLRYPETLGKKSPPFEYACNELVRSGKVSQKYDYVLIDEAQDSPVSFFRLCFQLTKGGEHDRNIVWAYDELQNIMNVKTLSADQAFGLDF